MAQAVADVSAREAAEDLLRKERRLRRRDVALGVVVPVALVVAWQLSADAGVIDTRIFSPPSEVLDSANRLISRGTLVTDVGATVGRMAAGYALGAAVGIAVGLMMGYFRAVRAMFSATFAAFYSMPKIAILPLLLIVFGLGETPKVLVVAITVFFVLQINTMAAVQNLDPRIVEAGRAYGATGMKLFRHVVLPGSLPTIFTGLRLAGGIALVVITATEFVASNNGLGHLIWNSWTLFQPEDMYVGLVTVALLGALVTGLVVGAERLAMPWKRRPRKRRQVDAHGSAERGS
jgi:ABC-type nitrate/sulfonate/bicarbonate transport system permease component